MTTFYAQPYDISAIGFYFENIESYDNQRQNLTNTYGNPVEEFEIQFIDGERIDCELAKAWSVNQANLEEFFQKVEDWEDYQKTLYIIAVGELGYSHDQIINSPDDLDIDIYYVENLEDLAAQFVDEGLFGEIPDRFYSYIDYEAIARDLSFDYCESIVAGEDIVYRAG